MDVRDFDVWLKEAQSRRLHQRAEAFAASLLPHHKADYIKQQIEELRLQIYGLEHEGEIDEIEEMAAERLRKMKEK